MNQQDDQISFNFGSDAKAATGGFEPIPLGEYRCVCEKIETGLTHANDKKWTAFLRIIEGPYTGRFLFERVTFNQKSQNFIFSFFRAFGWSVEPGGSITARQSDIIGRTCIVKVHGHTKGQNDKTYEDTVLLPDTQGAGSAQSAPPRAQAAPQSPPHVQPGPPQVQPGFGQQQDIPMNPPAQQAPQQQTQNGGMANPPF